MIILDLKHLNRVLVANITKIRALPFDVIVHLPRSGTIPASLLATYLIKPFASVEEFCAGVVNTRKAGYETLHRILLVDDSVRTGAQMQAAVERIKAERPDAEILTMAVYSTMPQGGTDKRIFEPDLCLHEHSDGDYIFPWFMWKTKKIRKCAVDMDGVLCEDCTRGMDDDAELYQEFLSSAAPKFLTEYPIGYIVTSRLERYRPQTEAWLKKHGISYRQLIMGPWKSRADRKGKAGRWKAKVYAGLPASLFIESNRKEAEIIHSDTGKRVWCVDSQEVLERS